MKKTLLLCFMALLLSSCFNYTSTVGKGPQGNQKITSKNHYILEGLVPVGTSDSRAMAGDSKDYSIHTRQTFLDGLLFVLTVGIYCPTTTTVTK